MTEQQLTAMANGGLLIAAILGVTFIYLFVTDYL